MKKAYVILIALFCWAGCKTAVQDGFEVNGTIENLDHGYVYFAKSGDVPQVDTVAVVKGHFTYKGKLTEPTVYMVNLGQNQPSSFVILENGTTTLTYKNNEPNSIQVKGGDDESVYFAFLLSCKPLYDKMDSIDQLAHKQSEDAALMQNLKFTYFQLDSTLKDKQYHFIMDTKPCVATAFMGINYLNEKMDKTLEDVEKIYNKLDPAIQQTYMGTKIAALAKQLKATSIGQVAPDFTLPDADGKMVSLSSFKGKITLLDFWASWCGPCRAENPNVVAAYTKFHPKGFDILGVSLDDQKTQWQSAIKKDELPWTHVSDLKGWNSDVAQLYGIQSIPSNLLLDKNGVILAKGLRGAELDAKLSELIK